MNYVICLTQCIYLVTDYACRLQVQKNTVLCATAAGCYSAYIRTFYLHTQVSYMWDVRN